MFYRLSAIQRKIPTPIRNKPNSISHPENPFSINHIGTPINIDINPITTRTVGSGSALLTEKFPLHLCIFKPPLYHIKQIVKKLLCKNRGDRKDCLKKPERNIYRKYTLDKTFQPKYFLLIYKPVCFPHRPIRVCKTKLYHLYKYFFIYLNNFKGINNTFVSNSRMCWKDWKKIKSYIQIKLEVILQPFQIFVSLSFCYFLHYLCHQRINAIIKYYYVYKYFSVNLVYIEERLLTIVTKKNRIVLIMSACFLNTISQKNSLCL